MNVIGIDPSLTGTAILQMNIHGKVTGSEVFSEAGDLRGVERLIYLRNRVIEKTHGNQPKGSETVVFMESLAFAAKGRGVTGLAELSGVVRVAMTDFKVRHYIVTPQMAKKWVTGKGVADKLTVYKSIIHKYKVDLESEDEYDAFAIAELGRNFLIAKGEITGVQYNWNESQKEVLKAMFKAEGLKCPTSLSNLKSLLQKARSKHQQKVSKKK